METLDKEASEIYEWKKASRKLLEHLENPERAAKEISQAKGDENKRDGQGDGDTPARVQSSKPKPVADFTPIRSKTFYRSKKTPQKEASDPPPAGRSPIQETLIALAENGGEPNREPGEKGGFKAPTPEKDKGMRGGIHYVGPPVVEGASKDYELYDEPTVELSDSTNRDEGNGPIYQAGRDAGPTKGKTDTQDGWVEEDIRQQAQEALRAKRRFEREE